MEHVIFDELVKLKIILFWEIVESQNFCKLDADFSAEKIYTDEQKGQLKEVWLRLYDEYFTIEDDAVTRAVLLDASKNLHALDKIQQLIQNIEFLMFYCNAAKGMEAEDFDEGIQKLYSIFKKLESKMAINYFGEIEKNIIIVNKWITSLSTTYELNHKRTKKDIKRRVNNIYDKVAEVATELGMQLNVHEMNCKEWLAYKKISTTKRKRTKDPNIKPNGKE